MVPAQQVQHAVHVEEGELGQWRVLELNRLADNSLPGDGKIAKMVAGALEREDVGDRVVVRERLVQPAQLAVACDPDRNGRSPHWQAGGNLWQRGGAGEHRPDK